MTDLVSGDGNHFGFGPARPRHLARAPITEALIDFRVQLAQGFSVEQFEGVARQIGHEYPTESKIRTVQTKLDFGGPIVKPDFQHGEIGVLVKSRDEKMQAQFRTNGFTLNRLEPYTSWKEIYPETLRLWNLYVEVAKPISVLRLAARYINKLKLPLPVTDLREFLTAPPRIPEALPQVLRAYLTRLIIHDPSREQSAIVTQSLEPNPVDPDHVTILLDVDAFKDVNLKPSESSEIHLILTHLHDFKNDIFFGSITQKASELFE